MDFHAPTHNNPEIPIRAPGETDEEYAARRQFELVDDLIANNNPLVYQQEHLAEFVDWRGIAFFSRDKMLVDGKPIETPKRVRGVFCTIDTATKTGTANDGTAVVYWGFNRIGLGRDSDRGLAARDLASGCVSELRGARQGMQVARRIWRRIYRG